MTSGFSAIPDSAVAEVIEVPNFRGCTALVLGAGASAPYGFPTGKQLVEDICRQFPDFFERLDALGSSGSERRAKAVEFVRGLRDSACGSIDEFLSNHARSPEIVEMGKIAVAASLVPKEDEDELRASKDWYEHLIQSWFRRPVKLGVITFNYDRSFEQRFWLALKARGGEEYARDIMVMSETQMIYVMHVHGQFGELPWHAPDGSGVPYGMAPKGDLDVRVLEAAKQLRLMFEQMSDSRLAEARYTLVRACRVLFVGFGYDRRNLARIAPKWNREALQPDAAIAGTGYGLTPHETQEVVQLLPQWAGPQWRGHPEIVPRNAIETIQAAGWLG